MNLPFIGAIIERGDKENKEVLIQTRSNIRGPQEYNGTYEFCAGIMDIPFENVFDTVKREIFEETGLKLKEIKDLNKTKTFKSKNGDLSFGFRPFCCTQMIKGGCPWIGFIFICEVEEGELKAQEDENKDLHWVSVKEFKNIFDNNPEKIFPLEIPAWEYYFEGDPNFCRK